MNNKIKVLLMTLVGVIIPIPFGNVLFPFFVKLSNADEKRFRKNIVLIELVATLVSFAVSISSWIYIIKENILKNMPIETEYMYPMFILPISVILIFVIGLIYVKRNENQK